MKLYNTLTRNTDELKPLNDNEVSIYSCGLTVYSQPHIGNWVGYIYWDVLVRVLEASGYKVNRVQNITDVGHLVSDADEGEDKMVKAAKLAKKTAWDVAEEIIEIADKEAFEILKLKRPSSLVRATDYIQQQIDFVKELEAKGYTYTITDNGVYFDTSKLDDYGKLARLDIKGLQSGSRVEDVGKKNPTDFALWKFSNKNEKRDMEWDSPWGKGFPGWHLECSVMARELLGDQIDIHCGGIDHIPVHHTNEIAQTEALTGKQFSQIWLHNNHIKVNGTKMAKSLGNVYTLDDIIAKSYSPEAFKLMVLSSTYKTEGNFTWEILEAAQNRLASFQRAADLKWQLRDGDDKASPLDGSKMLSILQNNLNTPEALSYIGESLAIIESQQSCSSNSLQEFLVTVDALLGLSLSERPDISDEQKELLEQRKQAREAKDWQTSDDIRDQLEKAGIGLNDESNGQFWYRK